MPADAMCCRAELIPTPISSSPSWGPCRPTTSSGDEGAGIVLAGTTMVVDFCIPNPGQSLLAAYQDWGARKAESAACDYGFHMAVTWWDRQVFDEMEACVKTYGINTFKHYMAYKGALMVNDEELYQSFRRCAGLVLMPLVHAENGDVVFHLQRHYLEAGITGPEGHAFSRPPAVEGEATNRAIMIADMAGCPLYVVHTSSRDAHEAIARARAAGKRVYGEPLIQHLVLDADEYRNRDWDHAARRVMSPPFRAKEHQASLWVGLQLSCRPGGRRPTIAPSPWTSGCTDFTKIPNGTGLKTVWWCCGRRASTPGGSPWKGRRGETSANPARILNIYPRKGTVAVGSDADLVIFDPDATKTVSAKTQVSRIDYNVFEGFLAGRGSPAATLARGKAVWLDGDLRAETGAGHYVPRPSFPAVHVANATWRELTAPRRVERVERADVTP